MTQATFKILYGSNLYEMSDEEMIGVVRLAFAALGEKRVLQHLLDSGFGVVDDREEEE